METKQKPIHLWQEEVIVPLFTGLELASGTAEYAMFSTRSDSSHIEDQNKLGAAVYNPSYPTTFTSTMCSQCNITLDNRDDLVAHYKLKWHQINVKRALNHLEPFSLETFENEKNSIDSASGSDVEEEVFSSDDEEDDQQYKKRPRLYFVNSNGIILSMFRTLLYPKRQYVSNKNELIHRATYCHKKLYWVVVLVGGGYFAAAVFKGAEVIEHRTFHSYTVRAKQGGSQTANDNRKAVAHQSAGSSLRRYNEKMHAEHIQEILVGWRGHIANCDLIFTRYPIGSHSLLFGGQNPIFTKGDSRLRSIPFPTKRANFQEVKRVHHLISKIHIHDKQVFHQETQNNIKQALNKPTARKKKSKKHRLARDRALSMSAKSQGNPEDVCASESSEGNEYEICLNTTSTVLRTSHLEEFGSSIEDERKAAEKKRLSTTKLKDVIYTACRIGNLEVLKTILTFCQSGDVTEVPDCLFHSNLDELVEKDYDLFSLTFGQYEMTCLHVAAEWCQKDIIWWLLSMGCDPCKQDLKDRTPYLISPNIDIRKQFRRFMAEFPDRYDYKKAGVSSPWTVADEERQQAKEKLREQVNKEKRIAWEKVKREEELKKKEKALKKQEEAEQKMRFLNLSDREKRALAAERRFLSSKDSTKKIVLQRCFQCAKDITGKIPFEYYEYKFCSTSCVKVHRQSSSKSS